MDDTNFNNVTYQDEDMYNITDDDFNMNNENIVPNFDMENFPNDNQIMSSFDISNKGELVQALNETCYYSSQLNQNFIHPNVHHQPFIQNGMVLNTELKPFKSPSYHIVKPIIIEIEQYTKEKFEYLENIRETHINIVNKFLNSNVEEPLKQLFLEYSQIIATNNRAISELYVIKILL